VVRAIQTVLEIDSPPDVLNVADCEPVTQEGFFRWLSSRLNRPMPPVAPVPPNRKRAVTNKRVANRRLQELLAGPMLYPSFREGYESELRRMGENASS
jgi:hypothetical protein